MILIWVICFVWVVGSIFVGFVAEKYERNELGWVMVSLFISPVISTIILIMLGNVDSRYCRFCNNKRY